MRLSTVFGLYRDGTELRGVMYSKPEVARAACLAMGDKCDFPILLGWYNSWHLVWEWLLITFALRLIE